ncbi:MAG: biopolymer transporter ExbB [Paracoccaceae bacterium]|uniref:biopolymer transporter ExbB n=1 Tax=Seohaeicola saemankumensis TaxID=481181 RepID=UPI001E50FE2A|nr:biopolymer transporter ExbB [Seohaeicola saemankumensis]MCD1626117.1 biopolymer transporter ExbB [Seohaeicola saemankumensis]
MDQPDREAEPQFSQPLRQIVSMLLVLGLAAFVVVLALPRVLPVFEANPYLNGFILFVFLIGVLACFLQVAQLINSVRWIEGFTKGRDDARAAPRLLAPLAALLRTRGARMQIGASSTRSILDSVATRIDEAREITRYIVNLLIFLGLLGTFYGLATTVPALVDTIRSLAPQEGEEGVAVFGRLMDGLDAQLSGMGVAFGSSLLGLAGSLVVGLLELFAGHGQNRFYRELEEWLSTITRVGFSSGDGDAAPDQAMLVQVVDGMAEQMEAVQRVLEQAEVGRVSMDMRLSELSGAVERLGDSLGQGNGQDAALTDALMRLAEGQERLATALGAQERGEGLDAESRMRLRSMDVQLLRILEEISAGRQDTMAELRTDLAALTRAVEQSRSRPAAPRPLGAIGQTQTKGEEG